MAVAILLSLLAQNEYLPLRDGDRLAYTIEDVGAVDPSPAREVVAEARSGADWIPVSNYLGYSRCWLRSTPEQVELKLEDREAAPSIVILKSGAKVGETWTGSFGKDELTFTMRGEVSLEHGDRRLRALQVEFSAAPAKHAGHDATRGDVWFAAGLGIVRAQITSDLDCHTSTSKVYALKPAP